MSSSQSPGCFEKLEEEDKEDRVLCGRGVFATAQLCVHLSMDCIGRALRSVSYGFVSVLFESRCFKLSPVMNLSC